MSENEPPVLTRLRERLRFQLAEPVDFTRTDPEATAAKVRLLTAAATYFNVLVVTEFGGRPGPVRQEGLVEQVVAAAFQTYRGEDPHPAPFDKAAMLLRGIIQGHPFTYANKRTGFLTAVYSLDRMGYILRRELSPAEVVSFAGSGQATAIDTLVGRCTLAPVRFRSRVDRLPHPSVTLAPRCRRGISQAVSRGQMAVYRTTRCHRIGQPRRGSVGSSIHG